MPARTVYAALLKPDSKSLSESAPAAGSGVSASANPYAIGVPWNRTVPTVTSPVQISVSSAGSAGASQVACTPAARTATEALRVSANPRSSSKATSTFTRLPSSASASV